MISLAWLVLVAQLVATPDSMTVVGPAIYRPLFPASPSAREIAVPAFRLDRTPVTNTQFLAFVDSHPEWRRGSVPSLFADESYLDRWLAPDALGPAVEPDQPVVDVSWFAARAYCAARGSRLPTEAQWELAAAAGATKTDAAGEPVWEWVEDFDASQLATGDGADALQSCAAGASASGDKTDFAAFQRFAMRSALRARYTTHHLGFRCAEPLSRGAS